MTTDLWWQLRRALADGLFRGACACALLTGYTIAFVR